MPIATDRPSAPRAGVREDPPRLSGTVVPLVGRRDLHPYDAMKTGRLPRREGMRTGSRRGGVGGAFRFALWKLLILREQGRVIAVGIRRSIQGGIVAAALVLSGCSLFDPGGSPTDQSPEPSPTPTEYEQSFAGALSGEQADVTQTSGRTGPGFTT